MRGLALFLLLVLPAWGETAVRSLQNDSDASVVLTAGGAEVGAFDRFGAGPLHVSLPLDLKTRAGVTRLSEKDGLIYAEVNAGAPRPISNRVNQYVTIFVDSQGNVRIRRWQHWYN